MSAAAEILLPGMLALALPIELDRLAARGGPTDTDREWARDAAQQIGERGDILLYRSRKAGETADIFATFVKALAIAAYAPGGVTLDRLGLHVCAGVPDGNGDTCHVIGGIRSAA